MEKLIAKKEANNTSNDAGNSGDVTIPNEESIGLSSAMANVCIVQGRCEAPSSWLEPAF